MERPFSILTLLICNPFSFAGPQPKQIELGAYCIWTRVLPWLCVQGKALVFFAS